MKNTSIKKDVNCLKTEYIAILIMMVVAVGLIYYGYNTFIRNKDLKSETFKSNIDVKALLEALGGKDNITDLTFSPSKFTVTLKDHSLVQIDTIKVLGASGIVQGKDNLSMIFGRQSALIAEDIKKLM